jgi:hypothetical protein
VIEKYGRAELDSHANTCSINNTARVLEYNNQVAEVSGFANSMQTLKEVPIVKAALAYDHPDQVLLNPNQLRAYGSVVDDVPLSLGITSHSITTPKHELTTPLCLRGIISYFPI